MNAKRRGAVSVLCALALAGIAAVPGGASASTAGKGHAAKVDTIQWGQVVYSAAYWAIYAGQQEGFFKKQNINLKITLIPSSPAIIAAAAGGSVNMFAVTSDSAVAAITKGANITLISGIQRVDGVQLVTAPGVKSITSLSGATIGVTNLAAADAVLFKALLGKHGVTDYTPIVSGSFPTKTAALLSGQIKAAELTPPWTQQVVNAGGTILGNGSVAVGGDNYAGWLSVGADKKWLASHRDLAVRFLKAYKQSADWLYNPKNKAKAIHVLASDQIGLTVGQATTVYRSFISSYKPGKTKQILTTELSASDLKQGIALARQEGVPQASSDTGKYWDASFMKAALK
ncbi:MAG TPA: ABC transporter substrate-binding protein [Solirubrobacteraceae bacterium]|nr:ABC transporter substrate-binding protein [Solirubrobacteraceae bacterium]